MEKRRGESKMKVLEDEGIRKGRRNMEGRGERKTGNQRENMKNEEKGKNKG